MDVLFESSDFPAYLVLADNGKKAHTKGTSNNPAEFRHEFSCRKPECGIWNDDKKQLESYNKTKFKVSNVKCVWFKEDIKWILEKKEFNIDDIDDSATIDTHIFSINYPCLHYGYYDEIHQIIKPDPEYWKEQNVKWDTKNIKRQALFLRQWGLLSNDMKLCSNYRKLPDFYQYHNMKRQNKLIEYNISSKDASYYWDWIMKKQREKREANIIAFGIDPHDPQQQTKIHRNLAAYNSIHISSTDPVQITFSEPTIAVFQSKRLKLDTLYIDFYGHVISLIPIKKLNKAAKSGSGKKIELKNLALCNDFLGVDDARNAGGNLYLSDTTCELGVTEVVMDALSILESQMERLGNGKLLCDVFNRVLSDFDPVILKAETRFFFRMSVKEYCVKRWNEFKLGTAILEILWIMICIGHFNHAIVCLLIFHSF